MSHTKKVTAPLGGALLLTVAAGWTAPQSNKGNTEDNDPDVRTMRDYRLSLENIKEFADASKALLANPVTRKCLNDNPPGNAATIDAGAKIVDGCPGATAIVKQNGLSTHDYTLMIDAQMGDWGPSCEKGRARSRNIRPACCPKIPPFWSRTTTRLRPCWPPSCLPPTTKAAQTKPGTPEFLR